MRLHSRVCRTSTLDKVTSLGSAGLGLHVLEGKAPINSTGEDGHRSLSDWPRHLTRAETGHWTGAPQWLLKRHLAGWMSPWHTLDDGLFSSCPSQWPGNDGTHSYHPSRSTPSATVVLTLPVRLVIVMAPRLFRKPLSDE